MEAKVRRKLKQRTYDRRHYHKHKNDPKFRRIKRLDRKQWKLRHRESINQYKRNDARRACQELRDSWCRYFQRPGESLDEVRKRIAAKRSRRVLQLAALAGAIGNRLPD